MLSKLLFHETNRVYRFFEGLKVVVIILSLYINPIVGAFRSNVDERLKTLANVLELFFLIDIVLNFFKLSNGIELWDEDSSPNTKVALRYLRSNFAWHFVAIIPLQFLQLRRDRQNLFFFLKVIRFREVSKYFTRSFMI